MTPDAPSGRGASSAVDVVVVGAGLSGLIAAKNLKTRGGGSVAVLEARDRVGGRTLNRPISGGLVVEAGGEYVGPTQENILKLLDELGIATFKAYIGGEDVYVPAEGPPIHYNPETEIVPRTLLEKFKPIMEGLEGLSAQITSPGEPWTVPNAQEWDSQTVHSWIMDNYPTDTAEGIEFVELFFNSAFGGRAMDVSLLFALTQIAGFGSEKEHGTLARGISGNGGAQENRIVGGSQLVSLKLAEELQGDIFLNAPVRKIEQDETTVTVVSDAGTWTAQHAIVAVPPPLAVEIEWSPLLPAQHDALRRRMALGTLAKVMAVYSESFWKKQSLSGCALKLTGTVKEMFHNTPQGSAPGVLLGFIGGHSWREWQGHSGEERREAVLTDFEAAFGPEAGKPIEYFEQDWTKERWTRGCPVSALETGVTTDFLPVLRQPFGLVHWAGSETADYWNGFMDGAVSSGIRAANELLEHS
jgi:monoamine oxidase